MQRNALLCSAVYPELFALVGGYTPDLPGKHGRALSRPGTPLTRLAKEEERIYIKKEPRLLRLTETGAGTARFAPPCTATKRDSHFTTPTHR